MDNVTLHWHRYLHVRWSNPIVQIFDTHPNDVGLYCFSKLNCDDDVVNLYESAGGTYISSAAVMANCKQDF